MRVAEKTIRRVVLAILAATPTQCSFAGHGTSQQRKAWEFKVQGGIVHFDLVRPTDFQSRALPPSLDITYNGEPRPSLSEEVGFLRQVLRDLLALGVDPHTLRSINMTGFAEPDVTRKVAAAAMQSKAWRDPSKTTGGAERLLEDLLNSLRVYDTFNAALEEYGLQVKTVGAEKVSGARCLELKIPDLGCSVHNNPRVPTGANLTLILEKKPQ